MRIPSVKNMLEDINSRIDKKCKILVSSKEHYLKIHNWQKQTNIIKRKEANLQEIWESIKRTNTQVIGVQEELNNVKGQIAYLNK